MALNDKDFTVNDRGQLVLLIAGVCGLLFLMFLLKHLLNPLGYASIFGMVLYPIRKQPVARAILYATFAASGFWLMYDSGHLLIPFIVAFIIAFLFNPIVEIMEKKRIPRILIAVCFTFLGFIIIGLLFFFTIPSITDQFLRLSKLFIEAMNNTDSWVEEIGIVTLAERFGFDSQQLQPQLSSQLHEIMTGIYKNVTSFSSKTVSGVTNIIGVLFFVILLPFLLFFMIRDYEKIGAFLRSLIFPSHGSDQYAREVGRIIGAYLRGQFIVVIISGFNLSLLFTLAGVPYGLVLGIFAGLTNFIPTFGLWFSVTVCTIVTASVGEPWYEYLPWIYLIFGVEQVLETGYIVPRVVGKQVGLHPITVMISLLLFGYMFGFLGLLIAVPTVALLSIFYEQYKETGQVAFLNGSDLDNFLQQLEKQNNPDPIEEK